MMYTDDPNYVASTSSSTREVVKDENHEAEKKIDKEDPEYYKLSSLVNNKKCSEVRSLLHEKQYKVKYEHEYTHMSFDSIIEPKSDEELNDEGWNVRGIEKLDSQDKTITVLVNTSENVARVEKQKSLQNTLESNFDPSLAVAAMERYGESRYPYGFKLHMVDGRLAEQALDENTWFMKYYCTVTNEYGQKIEQNCEAKIKGPEDHPTVYDFYVY